MSTQSRGIEPTSGIRGYLARVRYQRLAVETLRAAALVGGVLGLALLAVLLAAPMVRHWSTVRLSVKALTAAGGVALVASLLVAAVRLRSETVLARLVGERFPSLRSDLLSTVELLREPSTRFSRSLLTALAHQTWIRLSEQRSFTLGEMGRHLRPGALALATAAVAWTGSVLWKGDVLLRTARIVLGLEREAPSTASERIVRDLVLRYDYPAYMRRDSRVVHGSTGDITAPPGTKVAVQATTTHAAREAELVLGAEETVDSRPATRLRLTLSAQRRLRGVLTITEATHYRFELVDIDGRPLRDPVRQRIDIEPDLSPRALLRGPPDYLEVGELQRIELAYSAEDDWGLRQIDLCWRHNGHPTERATLWEHESGGKLSRRAAGRYFWNLERLDLIAGGRISYWIEAVDNDTVSGPKRTQSRVHHLSVFSAEQRHDRTLAQQQQLLEAALQLLSDRLLLDESQPPRPTERLARAKAFSALHTRQSRFSDGVRELRSQMDRDALVTTAVLRQISLMERRVHRLLSSEKRALSRITALGRIQPKRSAKGLVPSREIVALKRLNTRGANEMERDTLLLASLLDEQRLQSVTQAARRLKDAREHLNQLLERFRKTGDPRLKREILREIARMREQLGRLAGKMKGLQGTIADEYLNAEAVQRLDMSADLDRLQKLVDQGAVDQLEKALEALDDKLARMDSLLQGNLKQYRDERLGEREQAYGRLLDQLHEIESGQRSLAKQTAKLTRRYREHASRVMRGSIEPRLREQLAKVKQLRKRVDELQKRPLEPYDNEQLERISRWAGWLQEAVEQNDLPQSLEMVRRVDDQLKRVSEEMQEDMVGMFVRWRRRQQKTIEGVQQARAVAQEIEHSLDELFPSSDTLLDPADRAQMHSLQDRQQELKRRLSKMQKGDKGSAAETDLLGPDQRNALAEAGRFMQEATERLGRLRPQRAETAQREAADSLATLRRTLRRARMPRTMAGESTPRDRVKIPDAEAFEAPKAFREDLLEAMKEPAPKGYEPLVDQYYRELVR